MKSIFIIFAAITWLALPLAPCFADNPSLAEIRTKAEQSNPDAQVKLAEAYAKGEGVTQDDAEAMKWLRKAAEQGDGYAQYNLGVAYAGGQGVPRDYAESNRGQGVPKNDVQSVKWIRKAAEKGLAIAQYDLGTAYVKGEGVPRDYVAAYMWFSVAAVPGEEQYKGKFARTLAEASLASIERGEIIMTPDQIAQAQKLTAAWQPKAN